MMLAAACAQPAPLAPTAAPPATAAKPAATAAPAATSAPAATTAPAAAPAATTAPKPTAAPAATTAAAPSTATDKTFVYGFTQNPVGGCDGTQITVVATTGNCPLLNQEALIRYDDATKKIAPALAESWTYDGMSAAFKLRSGVKFQDGTAFDADAVVYNYRRVWDPSFPANQGVKFPYANNVPFKSIEKVDQMSVKIDFTQARADTLLYMTTWPAMIQSPTALQALSPADYTFKPVGTGPYVVTTYQDNARIEMDRNDSYWGPKPAFKKIVMVIKQDSAALVNDLLSGAIDAMRDPSIEQMDQITGKGLKIDTSSSLIFYGAQINVMKPPFDDVKVRQAANYAIDKEAVAKVSKGQAKPMYGAVPDSMREYNANVTDYKYDPNKAGQLLDEAGWTLPGGAKVRQKDGQPLSISIIQRTGYSGATALLTPAVLSNLQDVGFDVKTVTVEQALQYTDQGYFDTSKWNIGIGGWSSAIPDATATLSLWTSAMLRPSGLNMGGYSNKDFDQKMADASAAIDVDTHDKLLKDAEVILKNEAPWLWVYQQQNVIAYNPAKVASAPFRDLGVLDILRVEPK
jgi:peptide/nickel transport system substrate-binding protein